MVYNHTAEGNHLGPTLSFRGIDNAAYYRLMADDPLLHGLHWVWEQSECPASANAPVDHGQFAVLGAHWICTWMGFDSTSPPHWPENSMKWIV